MSLSFSSAFATLAIGSSITVANGLPEPTKTDGVPWRVWRSHNFTGTLVEKISGMPRKIVFQLPPDGNVHASYTVVEGLGHNFNEAGA